MKPELAGAVLASRIWQPCVVSLQLQGAVGDHANNDESTSPSVAGLELRSRGIRDCREPRRPGDPALFALSEELVVVLHIIWLIILGLVVGLIARAVVPGRQPMGWIATAVLGIVGAYVGGTLGSVVFPPHQFDIHPPIQHSFLGALVGAVLLLVIYKLVTSRTRTL
jgi:uncharacterized membrane protein YeaQ/YmgE (transglycosylase-associated protein family)